MEEAERVNLVVIGLKPGNERVKPEISAKYETAFITSAVRQPSFS